MKLSLGKKIVLLIIAVAVLLSGTCIAVSGIVNRKTMESEYMITSDCMAATVAETIDGDTMQRITEKVMAIYNASEIRYDNTQYLEDGFDDYAEQFTYLMEDPDFILLHEKLHRLQDVSEADYVYTLCISPKDKTCVYIVDGAEGEDFVSPGCFDLVEECCYPYLNDLRQGFPAFITDTSEYGWMATSCAPIYNSQGEVVCFAAVDLSMNEVLDVENRFLLMLAGILLTLTLLICIAAIIYVKQRIVDPINMLSEAAGQYGQTQAGSLHHEFSSLQIKTGDELEILLRSMMQMEQDIDSYINNLTHTRELLTNARQQADDMHELAHMDALTGIRNKLAYDKEIEKIDDMIGDGDAEFGIAMIDLNFLKSINDTYGHEYGNKAIKRLSQIICDVFAHSPVFRIGGDEFAVILRNHDYQHIEQLEQQFNQQMENPEHDSILQPWESISAAFGYALFDTRRDHYADDVFKRADQCMYERKKAMKALRNV